MLTLLFGDALRPQSQLPAFAASNPSAVLRSNDEVIWFTNNAMFKIVYNKGWYNGWAYETIPGDDLEPDDAFAFIQDRVLNTVVERLALQWRNHFE